MPMQFNFDSDEEIEDDDDEPRGWNAGSKTTFAATSIKAIKKAAEPIAYQDEFDSDIEAGEDEDDESYKEDESGSSGYTSSGSVEKEKIILKNLKRVPASNVVMVILQEELDFR